MFDSRLRLAAISAVAAILGGCSGAAPLPQNPNAVANSTIVRSAIAGPLLYVTDAKTHDVVVFSYPAGKQVGTLTGFTNPQGDCVDRAGDVWIVDIATARITEFAHGGTTPIATLSDAGQFPTACAVNPKTGDLAVSNIATESIGPGSISIYENARGTPANYTAATLSMTDSIAYDGAGNLFVVGTQFGEAFYYGELRSGAKALHPLHWPAAVIGAGIMWDGHHIAVVNAAFGIAMPVYRLAGDRLASTTYLNGTCNLFQFFVDQNHLICADQPDGVIRIYPYPNGGFTTGAIVDSALRPVAAVVSRT
jgi:hypothetical protein